MTTDDPKITDLVSFCELYCREKQFHHVSLARPGATNFAIRLQIEKAIEQQADYVVVGLTGSDRFDIPLDTEDPTVVYHLDNIWYTNYRAVSQNNVNQDSIKIVSDTINNILARLHQDLVSNEQLESLKHYISHLHSRNLGAQKEYYMISDGLRKLQSAGIEFVLIPGWMNQHDWSWVQRVWPGTLTSPYQIPYGLRGQQTPPVYTGTHNPDYAHREFCQSLVAITQDWS